MSQLPTISDFQTLKTETKNTDAREPSRKRGIGTLIVFEGLDRSGKTTQSANLVEYLNKLKPDSTKLIRFPDRFTLIGQQLNSFLQSKININDQALHLLFSANRWETVPTILKLLNEGKNVIIDRYSYSGIAYSVAKGLDLEWCKSSDQGLPTPDVVIYLSISPEAASLRGDYGNERYENKEFQTRVSEAYQRLQDSTWCIIKPTLSEEVKASISQIGEQVKTIALEAIDKKLQKL
jgi:dTMP kinase